MISINTSEFRYSRTKQFLSLRGFGVSAVSQVFRIESNRIAMRANVDTIPKVFVSGKLKAYSLRFLIQRSLRRIKVTSAYLLRIVATVSKQCQQSWFPFASMYCMSNILGISRALMNSVGATERAASTANIPSEMKAPVSFRRPS